MKNFSELNITTTNYNHFTGDKIEIYNVLNREIVVKKYKIEPSKFSDKGNGKMLTIQFDIDGVEKIIQTGSGVLMEMLEATNKNTDYPFKTKIVKEHKAYKFT
ncbi:MAG: hypothetical protein J7577_13395 [Sphingobacteriaceae bacterium]|nr:hypothetical protein [Sphingobacteriaceae bacterium]